MTPIVWGAIAGAISALLVALVGAATGFSVNRATATKLGTEARKGEADTAEVFTRLAAEWTQRADERAAQAEARSRKQVEELVGALDRVVAAVDRVTPLLERIAEHATAEETAAVLELRSATRAARRQAG